ncbi:putative Chromosomal replication initiator protein DnaA [Streptomyces aurantiacus JA 4570]|uniref:Putative Chromosomal replication initiator protein DnaA n=1 Tax=Streptomyces aurantiacus JA 4570 TaxID=1286094 RepID=S3ZQ59_9ACTN|nr:putative Chromosomal replication initiator protein DnaA [Streptomyces aurantiacus JA 4570]
MAAVAARASGASRAGAAAGAGAAGRLGQLVPVPAVVTVGALMPVVTVLPVVRLPVRVLVVGPALLRRLRAVVVLRLLGRVRVRVAVREAEAGLLPAVVVLGLLGPGAGALVVRIGGAGRRQLVGASVGAPAVLVPRAAAITVVRVMPLTGGGLFGLLVARRVFLVPRRLVLVPGLLVVVVAVPRLLLDRRRGRGRGLAHGVVDRDRDADRAAALPAQRLADDGGEPALQDALGELVRHGEQCGVGDERQRLAALDPVLVLRLDALPSPLSQKLFQNPWPHCGKIGRYVSHRARSLMGPTKVWFLGRIVTEVGRGRGKGTTRSSATVVRATGAVQVVVHRLCTVSLEGRWFDRMA